MTKKERDILLLTCGICLLPILVGLLFYPYLPAYITVNFNLDGSSNKDLPKLVVIVGLPIFLMMGNIFSKIRIFSKANKTTKSNFFAIWFIPLLDILLMGITFYIALKGTTQAQILPNILFGAVVFCSGIYFKNCKKSARIGIKLPWTLASEKNWKATHFFASYVWVIGGALMIFLGSMYAVYGNRIFLILLQIAIAIIIIAPILYSYKYYAIKEKNK